MTENRHSASYLKGHKRHSGDATSDDAEAKYHDLSDSVSKEERRAAKRRKKQARLNNEHNEDVSAEKPAIQESNEKNLSTANAVRKARKAQLKAARKAEQAGNRITPIPRSTRDLADGQTANTPKSLLSPAAYCENPALTALSQSEIDIFLSKNSINITDPSASTALRPIIKFSHLPEGGISPKSIFATFKKPTPIQSAAWPFLLSGRDVVGVAETGSGKTLAYGIPCIRSITASSQVSTSRSRAKAVIVSPTRELAVQIHSQIEQLVATSSLSTVCVYGGVSKDQQRAALKKAHVIVATPGRLNDLINEGAADLGSVNYLVLDEADRMLDKGFEEEVRKIISTTPAEGRQTLMFTATWPPSVRELASKFMTCPVHISIGADNPTGELRANISIRQVVEVVDIVNKQQRLLQILKQHQGSAQSENDRILVFCLYKKEAARIESFLRQRGLKVSGIHGDMGQSARQCSLDSFRNGTCPLLIATDVAARGLDIPSVKLVVNVTFPLTVEDYVHRIGRTGRAGAEGLAITMFTQHDKAHAGALINVLRAAGQEVPEELLRFGTTVKKREHEAYGGFYKDIGLGGKKEGTKIRFDD